MLVRGAFTIGMHQQFAIDPNINADTSIRHLHIKHTIILYYTTCEIEMLAGVQNPNSSSITCIYNVLQGVPVAVSIVVSGG